MFATSIDLILVSVALVACAVSAGCCLKALRLVAEIRSLRSLQGEIAEIDVSVASIIKAVRRMEGRQTATMGRASKETQDTTSELDHMDKAALRRYVGLVPGKPVRAPNGTGSTS